MINPAEVIVDLYEMRASTLKPLQARQMEKVEDLHRYNFFNVVIAKLMDKYGVRGQDVEEVIRQRSKIYVLKP